MRADLLEMMDPKLGWYFENFDGLEIGVTAFLESTRIGTQKWHLGQIEDEEEEEEEEGEEEGEEE